MPHLLSRIRLIFDWPPLTRWRDRLGARDGARADQMADNGPPARNDSDPRVRAIIDTAAAAFVAADERGKVTDWNPAAEQLFGWRGEEILGRRLADTIVPAADRARHTAGLARFVATGRGELVGRRTEMVAACRDGTELHVALTISAIRTGDTFEFTAFIHDISERKQAEDALAEAEERFRKAFDHAPIGMTLTSLNGVFLRVNRALCDMLGRPVDDLAETRVSDITHPEDRAADEAAMQRMARGEATNFRAEKRYAHADGHWVWAALSASIVHDAHGRPLYFVSQMEDITERREAEKQLAHLADHDPLTDLYNRRRFALELDRALAYSQRYRRPLALLVIDLDNFKQVNDTLGHRGGDQAIARVAQLLRRRLRRADVLARIGGDELAAILPETNREQARIVGAKLLEAVRASSDNTGRSEPGIRLSASIGIGVLEPPVDKDGEQLLRDADTAMYDAKRAGRDRYMISDEADSESAKET
jgi:diguanylate cyclase (GGDEF)-like protein/PAS domain S-box-containing protein